MLVFIFEMSVSLLEMLDAFVFISVCNSLIAEVKLVALVFKLKLPTSVCN